MNNHPAFKMSCSPRTPSGGLRTLARTAPSPTSQHGSVAELHNAHNRRASADFKSLEGKEEIKLRGQNANFRSFLQRHKVKELSVPLKVIELDSEMTPLQGFEILLRNNILSAPVYDKGSKKYVGFLDVRDLVSSIIYACEEKNIREPWNETWTETVCHGMNKFSEGSNSNSASGISDSVTITYLARRNPFKPVQMESSLEEVAKILNSGRLHRVPVVNEEGKCVAILSQSTLIQFFGKHLLDELREESKQTLLQTGLGQGRKVLCVDMFASALNAFKLLDTSGVSGIAVVDQQGKLIGNTSAKDLKYFVLDRGSLSMEAPILDYLTKIRQREVQEKDRHPACSVSLNSTLLHVIGLLSATHFHRVFVVDQNAKPIGVVSITDILRFATADLESPTEGPAVSASSSSPSSSSKSQLSNSPRILATPPSSNRMITMPSSSSPSLH